MHDIRIKGFSVFLNAGSAFTIKMRNPAFNDEGAFTYPLTVYISRNRAIFGHLESEDTFTPYSEIFSWYFDGELFFEGDVMVIEKTGDRLQMYFKSGKSSHVNILKQSFLDDAINGLSWGTAPGGLADINTAYAGTYPDKQFTIAPVQLDDRVLNEWDLAGNQLLNPSLGDGDITPMVYVRHLINRINAGLGLINETNDFESLTDFNRLAILSPRTGNFASSAFENYKEWLPHITALDLLNDLEARFNIIPFFSPLGQSVDYIQFDKLLTGEIKDWTNKFVRDESVPSFKPGQVIMKNSASDNDGLSPEEIEQRFDLVQVLNYDDMTFDNEAYKVTSVDRYFKRELVNYDNDSTKDYFVKIPKSASINKLTEEVSDTTEESVNAVTTPGIPNEIAWFEFDVNEAQLYNNVHFYNIEAKASVISGCLLIADVYLDKPSVPSNTLLGSVAIPINNTAYEKQDFFINLTRSDEFKDLVTDAGNPVNGDKLYIRLFSLHPTTASTITLQYGNVGDLEAGKPFTTITIDKDRNVFKELGVVGKKVFGTGAENVETVSPVSQIPYNKESLNDNYKFQMPVSDIAPAQEQKDYAYVMYRGVINDEVSGNQNAPYLNFDSVDIYMEDYQSRVTYGSSPDLSLRWHGTDGLESKLRRQRNIWFANYRRPVRKTFRLNLHDIMNLKFYERIQVENSVYLVNQISVKSNVNGDLGEAELELFTV